MNNEEKLKEVKEMLYFYLKFYQKKVDDYSKDFSSPDYSRGIDTGLNIAHKNFVEDFERMLQKLDN